MPHFKLLENQTIAKPKRPPNLFTSYNFMCEFYGDNHKYYNVIMERRLAKMQAVKART